MLPELSPDALYVFLFGPGTGELIVVRAPPDHWLVVDGCGTEGRSYGKLLLEHYGARPTLIVLTHRHLDHAKGVGDVIDAATDDVPPEDWPAIGLVLPPSVQGAGDLSDMPRAYRGGVAEEAVAAILTRWDRHRGSQWDCRWDLLRGDVRALGEAHVKVVAPSPERRADAFTSGERVNPNTIATVLLVEWASHRVVLGSDLADAAPEGWSAALSHAPGIADPSLLKIAHHGSREAQHAPLLAGKATTLVGTPFASQRLPRFDTGQGAEWLLARAPAILLTAMPRSYAKQGVEPRRSVRGALDGAGLAHERHPGVTGFPDCFVVMELARDGTQRAVRGQGSIMITP